jgi:hypothetical protein
MTELIPAPSEWNFRLSHDAATLKTKLSSSHHRLLSIKTYLDGKSRIYSGVSIKDEGLGGGWDDRITPPNLTNKLGKKFRLTALDCFEEKRQTLCTAAWIENKPQIKWNWDCDLTVNKLNQRLEKDDGKLTSIRVYKTTLGGKLTTPALRYCAIWIKDDDVEWGWIPDAVEDSISDTLDANSARLISIDNLDNENWLDDNEHFCAVWYKQVIGPGWFWNIGLDKSELPNEPSKFCSWPLDVSYCSKNRYVSLMEQFPKQNDPNLANLMTMGGSAGAIFRDDLWEEMTWNVNEQNFVSEQVDIESGFMFSAAEGGWSWFSGNLPNLSPPNILGLPLSLAASQAYNFVSSWGGVSNGPKIGVFPLKAVASGGKHQFLLSQVVITQASFSTPPALPIKWPVFLGIQGPVEIIKLTNGKHWGTLAAQVVNGTSKKLDITNIKVKLKDQNNVTVHKAYFTKKMRIDMDVLGNWLDHPLDGPVSNSDAPLPKFYDGFEVPRSFTKGTLKVQANVKFREGKLECYGDQRTLTVERAPITVMDRLPVDVPVINGKSDPSYRWFWGSGMGGTQFNVHSYPEERYYYDVGLKGPDGNTFKDANKMSENDNYHCWGRPVLSMSSGEVIFTSNDFEDNFGNVHNDNSIGANTVVIRNDTLNCYHVYVHLKQHSIIVTSGDPISPGDKLGLVGNSGGTSEPHLHVGISGRDSEGFLRSLPMTFQKVKNGAGKTVSGVLATDDFYNPI